MSDSKEFYCTSHRSQTSLYACLSILAFSQPVSIPRVASSCDHQNCDAVLIYDKTVRLFVIGVEEVDRLLTPLSYSVLLGCMSTTSVQNQNCKGAGGYLMPSWLRNLIQTNIMQNPGICIGDIELGMRLINSPLLGQLSSADPLARTRTRPQVAALKFAVLGRRPHPGSFARNSSLANSFARTGMGSQSNLRHQIYKMPELFCMYRSCLPPAREPNFLQEHRLPLSRYGVLPC